MKNLLSGCRVYLSGAINFEESPREWRERIKGKLSQFKLRFLDPCDKCFYNEVAEDPNLKNMIDEMMKNGQYAEAHEIMKKVIKKDLRMVDLSDFLIIRLDDVKTFGTTHEIAIASLQSKPCLIIVPDLTKTPLWIVGLIKPEWIFGSEEDLIEYLSLINDGKYIDFRYWKLLLPEIRN
jgi:nucleoside 2-deoxyribosyltransferase